ncbi:MAG: hypothetical protein MUC84_05625 [Solirubrobacteraceae bacterium]|jgi:hypothetical protein|nr:hypothetical protein [Solirubrobacteraceae bacterium]
MSRRLAAWLCALAAAAGAAGCGAGAGDESATGPAVACLQEDQVLAALRAAPQPVRLPDGTRLSECLRAATADAALQNLGVVLTAVSDRLADDALDGRREAALALGYLIGAADAGSRSSQGIQLELARRLEGSARRIDGTSPAIDAAVLRGLAAGRETG